MVCSKYGKCLYEHGKPLSRTVRATFKGRFEHDARWFARIEPDEPGVLRDVYAACHIPLTPDIIVKLPFRYNRFSCYVSKFGVASSVHDITPGDGIECCMTMTNSSERMNWKCNNINVHTQHVV